MSNNSRGFSPVLAFLLGFLFAIIVVVGSVVAGVVYALNFKLDNVALNKEADGSYKYINVDPEGKNATALLLAQNILQLAKDPQNLTLGELESNFPIANKLTDKINAALSGYATLDMEKLKATKVSELSEFLKSTVMGMCPATIVDKLGGSVGNNAFVKKLLYDAEGNAITLGAFADGSAIDNFMKSPILDIIGREHGDLTNEILGDMTVENLTQGVDFAAKVNNIALDSFIKAHISTPSSAVESILAYVIYGVSNLKDEEGEIGGKAYTHTATYSPLTGANTTCYVKVEDGKIVEVFKDSESGIVAIKGTKVGDMSDRARGIIKDLTIGQLMNISGNKILDKIKNSTIESLSEDIDGLAVNELYAENIYSNSSNNPDNNIQKYLAVTAESMTRATAFIQGYVYYTKEDNKYILASTTGKIEAFEDGVEYYTCGEGKILFDTAFVYYDASGNILNKGQENAGKLTEFAQGHYTYGGANAMWKLMLYSNENEIAFSVNGFTKMIENVSKNIEKATMRELDEAGILKMGTRLDIKITFGVHSGKTIGDLKLSELIVLFVSLVETQSQLPQLPN